MQWIGLTARIDRLAAHFLQSALVSAHALFKVTASPPRKRASQHPLLGSDRLLVLKLCLSLPPLLDQITAQDPEHNIILRSRKIYQAHPRAICLLARRVDDAMNIGAQHAGGEFDHGIAKIHYRVALERLHEAPGLVFAWWKDLSNTSAKWCY